MKIDVLGIDLSKTCSNCMVSMAMAIQYLNAE